MTRCYNIKKILELHIKSTMLYDMIWLQDLHNNKTNIKHQSSISSGTIFFSKWIGL